MPFHDEKLSPVTPAMQSHIVDPVNLHAAHGPAREARRGRPDARNPARATRRAQPGGRGPVRATRRVRPGAREPACATRRAQPGALEPAREARRARPGNVSVRPAKSACSAQVPIRT